MPLLGLANLVEILSPRSNDVSDETDWDTINSGLPLDAQRWAGAPVPHSKIGLFLKLFEDLEVKAEDVSF